MLLLADVYKGVWLKGNNSSCYHPVMLPLLRFTKRSHFCHVTNGHPLATGFSDDTLVKTFNAGTRLWHCCVLEHISYSCGKWWQMKTSLNLLLDDLSVGGSGCCLLQKEKSWASLFYFDDERDREVTITIHQCNWSNHLCWHTIITSGTLCHRWSSCVLQVNCVTIDQSERITRMAITRSFPCSGSVCCGKFVAQIETFASHIGDTRCWHLQQLVCHKNCHFCVSSKCLCHTLRCHNMTQSQTMWGVHPPSSSRRMLPQFDDFGKQRSVYARGVAGGGEGGQTCKKFSLSSNLNLVPHTWSFVGMPWKGERRRGVARSTPSWEEQGGKRLLFGQQRKFTCCWYFPQLSWNWLLIVMYLIVLADLHCFWEPYSYCIANKNFFNVCSRKEQHWLYQHNSILI